MARLLSMDLSCGRGWSLRRIVPLALAGAGVCAALELGALASGGATVASSRTHLVAQRSVAPAGVGNAAGLGDASLPVVDGLPADDLTP